MDADGAVLFVRMDTVALAMTELADLVGACQAGDPAAFDALVRRFQDMVFAVALAQGTDPHLAQDVCQEAFLTAFRELKARRLAHPHAFPAWLRTVTVRLCSRTRARTSSAVAIVGAADADGLAAAPADPAQALAQHEERDLIHAALRALPPGQRLFTSLYYLGGQSAPAIAAFLELPLTTVTKRLHDARRRLRARLASLTDPHRHPDAPSRDERFRTVVALCHAADMGDAARVQAIVATEPALACREEGPGARHEEKRAIHYAAAAGHAPIVGLLLEAGADPLRGFWPYRDTTTPWALAQERGHAAIVTVIEQWLRRTSTPASDALAQALRDGDAAAVRAAVAADPTLVRTQTRQGEVPLGIAVDLDREHLVALLLALGADVHQHDRHRCLPIHRALVRRTDRLTWATCPASAVAQRLLDAGAIRDCWVACATGDTALVRRLIAADPSVARTHTGAQQYPWGLGLPLAIAALGGHTDIVRLLLDAGADPDARQDRAPGAEGTEHGLPHVFAAMHGHLAIVRLLLARGAGAVAGIAGFPTGASLAFQNGSDAVADLLVAHGDRIDFLAYARREAYDRMAQALRVDPERYGEAGWQAAFRGDPRLLQLAWAAMERLRITPSDDLLCGWLRQSLRMDDRPPAQRTPGSGIDGVGVFALIVARMRTVDYHRGDGVTLLHHVASDFGGATDADRVALAGVLLAAHARLDIRDTDHQATALAWACRHGHAQLVAFLLEHGARPSLPGDTAWNTPQAMAQQRGHDAIVALLRAHGATP